MNSETVRKVWEWTQTMLLMLAIATLIGALGWAARRARGPGDLVEPMHYGRPDQPARPPDPDEPGMADEPVIRRETRCFPTEPKTP